MATVERVMAVAMYRILIPAGVLVGLQLRLRSRGRPPVVTWRDAAGLYLALGLAFAVPYLLLLSPGELGPGVSGAVLAFLRTVVFWPGLLLFIVGGAVPGLPGPN